MQTFAYEYRDHYQIIVTDGTKDNSFSSDWGKDQLLEISEHEALLLVEAATAPEEIPVPVQ